MTRSQQKNFVRDLSRTISEHICAAIDAGKVPEEWDGHELRCWLAEQHAESAAMTCIRNSPRQKRARAYRNHLLITPGLT